MAMNKNKPLLSFTVLSASGVVTSFAPMLREPQDYAIILIRYDYDEYKFRFVRNEYIIHNRAGYVRCDAFLTDFSSGKLNHTILTGKSLNVGYVDQLSKSSFNRFFVSLKIANTVITYNKSLCEKEN